MLVMPEPQDRGNNLTALAVNVVLLASSAISMTIAATTLLAYGFQSSLFCFWLPGCHIIGLRRVGTFELYVSFIPMLSLALLITTAWLFSSPKNMVMFKISIHTHIVACILVQLFFFMYTISHTSTIFPGTVLSISLLATQWFCTCHSSSLRTLSRYRATVALPFLILPVVGCISTSTGESIQHRIKQPILDATTIADASMHSSFEVGPRNADTVLLLFASFECGACRQLVPSILDAVRSSNSVLLKVVLIPMERSDATTEIQTYRLLQLLDPSMRSEIVDQLLPLSDNPGANGNPSGLTRRIRLADRRLASTLEWTRTLGVRALPCILQIKGKGGKRELELNAVIPLITNSSDT